MSITLKSLDKSFGGKRLFHIEELTLPTGFTCLMGPSGCGKTTLGRIIAGLEKADSGNIEGAEGHPTVLFQESRLLPALSAIDNVKCVCRTNAGKELSRTLLLKLGFDDKDLNKLPSELSGGMERRVAIARSIIFSIESGGSFVLLDEPFTGLDDETKHKAAELLKEHLKEKTVLTVTHDEDECDLLGGQALLFSTFSN